MKEYGNRATRTLGLKYSCSAGHPLHTELHSYWWSAIKTMVDLNIWPFKREIRHGYKLFRHVLRMNEKNTVKERLTPKQCLTVKPFLPGTCESPQSFAALTVLALKKRRYNYERYMYSAFNDTVPCIVSKCLYIYLRGQNFKNVSCVVQGNPRQLCYCVYSFNYPLCL